MIVGNINFPHPNFCEFLTILDRESCFFCIERDSTHCIAIPFHNFVNSVPKQVDAAVTVWRYDGFG